MLKTFTRFTSSFAALLTDDNTIVDVRGRMESIRIAMLDELTAIECNPLVDVSRTWSDTARAGDIQALWFLRSDMLRLLSQFYGEEGARTRIDRITEMFRGVVPDNYMLLAESGGGPRRIRR
jgi:hypothetical protein